MNTDMSSIFSSIVQEFNDDLGAMKALLRIVEGGAIASKIKIAGANSVVLLLAATYEEFVREMAREYAKHVVSLASDIQLVPESMLETAWRRTLEDGIRGVSRRRRRGADFQSAAVIVKQRIDALIYFMDGDKQQDIYDNLIHNENNMRTQEMNSLFKVSGLDNVCRRICDYHHLTSYFQEADGNRVHGLLINRIDRFFDKRNEIAHSLRPGNSWAPDMIREEIGMLAAIGEALREVVVTGG